MGSRVGGAGRGRGAGAGVIGNLNEGGIIHRIQDSAHVIFGQQPTVVGRRAKSRLGRAFTRGLVAALTML